MYGWFLVAIFGKIKYMVAVTPNFTYAFKASCHGVSIVTTLGPRANFFSLF